MIVNGRAIAITGHSCPGQLTTLSSRLAQARSHFPAYSVRQGSVRTPDGTAVVYRSNLLARELPRDLFLDCHSTPVPPGTFVLNARYAGHDWALAIGTCG
jgi:hypothetical protein